MGFRDRDDKMGASKHNCRMVIPLYPTFSDTQISRYDLDGERTETRIAARLFRFI